MGISGIPEATANWSMSCLETAKSMQTTNLTQYRKADTVVVEIPSPSYNTLITKLNGILTLLRGCKNKQGLNKHKREIQESDLLESASKSYLPSTILPSFWKILSSHHWQWMRYLIFFAESSAGDGPLKTLTTTRTKCSRATASKTSMPLLQRAAAL